MKKKIWLSVLLFLGVFFSVAYAQTDDEKIFRQYINSIDNHTNKDSLFIQTALYFTGSRYQASTLEVNAEEQLITNLVEFDCTTFIETCMALTQTLYTGMPSFDEFQKNLQTIRYRNGKIDGYTSRLHYVTDWITDNQNKAIIGDKTRETGGMPLAVHLNYMSAHLQYYPALKNNTDDIKKIKEIENAVNQHNYHYIPKTDIRKVEKNIHSGDILFFTTSIAGLDVSHAGIAYSHNGQLTFIHASSKH